tara:strand:- start:1898 stop:2407 length:510 start_codon:yes stop_codon:yes gene_type:complete
MIENKVLYEVSPELSAFIEECGKLGYKNNSSLDAMNFQKTLDEGGAWFATYVDDKIVGLSGVHKFRDGYRALYRGCQLYSRSGGLSKNHMNCWMFYYHLPLAIYCTNGPIYITTNTSNDASGKMLRLDKLYHILAKKTIVKHVSTEELFGVEQNIWLLHEENYIKARGG